MAYPSSPAPNSIKNVAHSVAPTGYIVKTARAEDGTMHTRLISTDKKEAWELTYTHITGSDCTALDNWHAGVYGPYSSDTWTHPYTSASHTIRAVRWNKVLSLGTDRYTYTVTLEED